MKPTVICMLTIVSSSLYLGCSGNPCERYAEALSAKSEECNIEPITIEMDLTTCTDEDFPGIECAADCFDGLTCAGIKGEDASNADAYVACLHACPGVE